MPKDILHPLKTAKSFSGGEDWSYQERHIRKKKKWGNIRTFNKTITEARTGRMEYAALEKRFFKESLTSDGPLSLEGRTMNSFNSGILEGRESSRGQSLRRGIPRLNGSFFGPNRTSENRGGEKARHIHRTVGSTNPVNKYGGRQCGKASLSETREAYSMRVNVL